MYLPATPEIERAARYVSMHNGSRTVFNYLATMDEAELLEELSDTLTSRKLWRSSWNVTKTPLAFVSLVNRGRKIAAIRRVARLRGWDLGL